ncbi:MAG: glycosyltransferase [Lachnospiraceae bacterium]|nr:glycosyltransferase [Lachnospiraceae bacterium]
MEKVIPIKEEKPLISVIVPVYNGQDYLENCITSIEHQTYDNLEIIIINDGSTDRTGAICVKLKEKYDNIRVVTLEDEGVSVARNAGIDMARGGFLTFVDADDRLRPKALEVLYDSILSTGCDIAGCRFQSFQEQKEWDKQLKIMHRIKEPAVYKPAEYLKKEILKGNSRCWSKLYRRSVVGNLRFQKGLSIGEDMLFLMELLPYVKKIAETDYPGYGYYQNPKGAMNREFTPKYMDQITCWEMARDKAIAIDKSIEGEITTILLMSIMLVAGKIALLSLPKRRQQREAVRTCRDKLKKELKVQGAYDGLSKGYRLKVRLFQMVPGLYLSFYHFRKYL